MSNITLNIINSMSMSEKRYFKIFCNRNRLKNQNKYLVLFNLISKKGKIDIDEIKEKYNEKNYSISNLSADINYLDKMLLKVLNEYNINKTCNIKFKQNLISIEILFYKGLYKECLSLIKKTKKINKKNENKVLMLDLLNWEKKCLGYSEGFYSALEINNTIDQYYNGIAQNKLITDLYYRSYFLLKNIGNIPQKELLKEFDKIIKNPGLQEEGSELISMQQKAFFQLIFANYYHVKKKSKKELTYLERTVAIYNNNVIYRSENPLGYVSLYNRVLDIVKFEKDNIFKKRVNELRNFDSIVGIQKNVVNERIFLHTHKAELENLIYNNKLKQAAKLLHHVKKEIDSSKFTIEPYYYIALYYLFSCIHCKLNDYSSGLKFINRVLNKYHFKQSPRVYIKSELLNLLIHFELKNYELVASKTTIIIKKYTKAYRLNFIEKRLFKLLIKISKKPAFINSRVEFNKLNKILLEKRDHEKVASNHFYFSYIKTKI